MFPAGSHVESQKKKIVELVSTKNSSKTKKCLIVSVLRSCPSQMLVCGLTSHLPWKKRCESPVEGDSIGNEIVNH